MDEREYFKLIRRYWAEEAFGIPSIAAGGWRTAEWIIYSFVAFGVVRAVEGNMSDAWQGAIAAGIGLFLFGAMHLARSLFRAQKRAYEEIAKNRDDLRAKLDTGDGLWQERLNALEQSKKEAIAKAGDEYSRLQMDYYRIQEDNAKLREADNFKHALQLKFLGPRAGANLQFQTLFRLEAINTNAYRTLEGVCVKVLSIAGDRRKVTAESGRLLTISGTDNHMPNSPCEVRRDLTAKDSLVFDLARVHPPPGNHSLVYGECVEGPQPEYGSKQPTWRRPDGALFPGRYRVVVEARAKDVAPVRMAVDFWGDKAGVHCEEVDGDSELRAAELSIEERYGSAGRLEHEHHWQALRDKLQERTFAEMTPVDAYGRLCDSTWGSLHYRRFVTKDGFALLSDGEKLSAVLVSDECAAKFAGGIPGFPNAVHYDDFLAAWNAVRASVG
jgi:hypothetical protein